MVVIDASSGDVVEEFLSKIDMQSVAAVNGTVYISNHFGPVCALTGDTATEPTPTPTPTPEPPVDSYEDGLTDDKEQELGTDPQDADSDADGLTDGNEVNKVRTDPLDADTDAHGEEFNTYGTDPLDVNTDDGIMDCREVNVYETDPLNGDTDGDGGSDGEEVERGTDPTTSDT